MSCPECKHNSIFTTSVGDMSDNVCDNGHEWKILNEKMSCPICRQKSVKNDEILDDTFFVYVCENEHRWQFKKMVELKKSLSFGQQLKKLKKEKLEQEELERQKKEKEIRNDPVFIDLVSTLKHGCLKYAEEGLDEFNHPYSQELYNKFKEPLLECFSDCNVMYKYGGIRIQW